MDNHKVICPLCWHTGIGDAYVVAFFWCFTHTKASLSPAQPSPAQPSPAASMYAVQPTTYGIYFQTLNAISTEQSSTIVFPFPIDTLCISMGQEKEKEKEKEKAKKKDETLSLKKDKKSDWLKREMWAVVVMPGEEET